MAGMTGYEHNCDLEKIIIKNYKKSLSESTFSLDQIDTIWDFYVTHSLCDGSGLKRDLSDYGWENKENGEKGYNSLEKKLKKIANIELLCFIRSTTCKDTRAAMDLSGERICIEHPRGVLIQKHKVTVDENERMSFSGGSGSENKITCLFRHIRNSFAHGNTYFFDNDNLLLIDKDNSTITATLLIPKKTLLDWIRLVDNDKKFYQI